MTKSVLMFMALVFGFGWKLSLGDVVSKINLPKGFKIEIYAEDVENARSLALAADGTLFVGTLNEGKVYALPDQNHDGKADKTIVIAKGLIMPNGVAVLNDDLYVAEVRRILRYKNIVKKLGNTPVPEVVFDWYPTNVHHGWKYLQIGPDGKLYAPVGAPCNICKSKKPVFASITRLNLDGSGFEIIARGVRNSVGFDWHPKTKKLWFTENGRDWLGDDVPPDELNHVEEKGQHFGYPYCHAGDIPDPKFAAEKPCDRFVPPDWRFPAHVAPLGIKFYRGRRFPKEYHQQLFVAQHGSWNRSQPQGYRIVVIKVKNGKVESENVFADGWLQSDGRVLGRPVDILELADGNLLVSDDKRGVIYKISYAPGRSD